MANIAPFKGTRYNEDKIKDFSKVVAPPYDVISKDEQDELYKMSEYNIVRMLLGKDLSGDDENENKYTRAKKYLKAWQENKVLKKDLQPSIYINLQEFKLDGRIKRRIGFLVLLKLEEFDTKTSSIYPHEFTLAAPKEDRARLIHSIEANLGPIFAIFEDRDRSIAALIENEMESKPIADIFDNHGVRNKFWRVFDKKILGRLCGYMKDKKLFIADGHHRYEVGMAFSKSKLDPKYGYILTYFTDLLGDGLVVLPYHRIVGGLDKAGMEGLETTLKKNFITAPLKSEKVLKAFLAEASPSHARFVIYAAKKFTGLIFKDKKDLDVTIAKNLIIDPLGKISIDFTKDLDYAIKEVDTGKFSFAILVNPVKITEIRDTAFGGDRMPQKSTYFYPKVLTGLVINVF
ncbi:MAG: hypothetical protein CO035_04965 [Candidatus Omnitrophica bacterium CG_4_9_14_0_2_um_filter_42_8]|nr:MAG: hypothetical protein COW92_04480 [Candidatus Omnitrophica bacterium CG22_combo_CG10-13_8_21_14_all_43_16]PJC48156.1 MAG: hypothetical protein CO035_04965 [Candidatus Omnitrophica bacterium CG_4_9_14_0_2_um_filter_42_8]